MIHYFILLESRGVLQDDEVYEHFTISHLNTLFPLKNYFPHFPNNFTISLILLQFPSFPISQAFPQKFHFSYNVFYLFFSPPVVNTEFTFYSRYSKYF